MKKFKEIIKKNYHVFILVISINALLCLIVALGWMMSGAYGISSFTESLIAVLIMVFSWTTPMSLTIVCSILDNDE